MKDNNYLDAEVYVTFKTTRGISKLITNFAHEMGKTQTELLNELCLTFIKATLLDEIQQEPTETATEQLET